MVWETLESDQAVFTYLIENIGVKGVEVSELLELDEPTIADLQPYGLIFLFKYANSHYSNQPSSKTAASGGNFDPEASENIFFANQRIQNACASQAILSILLNSDDIDIGDQLHAFKDFVMPLPSEYRGEALSNSDLIRSAHNSFARSSPFDLDDPTKSTGDQDAFHYVAYVPIHGRLYELDGLQNYPIAHGDCSTKEEFAKECVRVIKQRIEQFESSEVRFNLMAVVKDMRQKILENANLTDSEKQIALSLEDDKRREWTNENILRRHNFIGTVETILKEIIKKKRREAGPQAVELWINELKQKAQSNVS